ncbi:hypothetical protein ES703_117610 [subsurface metagenome]
MSIPNVAITEHDTLGVIMGIIAGDDKPGVLASTEGLTTIDINATHIVVDIIVADDKTLGIVSSDSGGRMMESSTTSGPVTVDLVVGYRHSGFPTVGTDTPTTVNRISHVVKRTAVVIDYVPIYEHIHIDPCSASRLPMVQFDAEKPVVVYFVVQDIYIIVLNAIRRTIPSQFDSLTWPCR